MINGRYALSILELRSIRGANIDSDHYLECEELEMLAHRNAAQKFYQKIRQKLNGFKTGAGFCREEDGNP